MAKLSSSPITDEDIRDYLSTFSDFSFELEVLNTLTTHSLSCEHSGTYEDPVSAKARQYDIRALAQGTAGPPHQPTIFRFAVECKNLRPNYPLVVHCLPRTPTESFLDVVYASNDSHAIAGFNPECGRRVTLLGAKSPYPAGVPVGKAADQVGKRNGEIVSGDQDTFDRLAQALNSAHDLLRDAHFAAEKGEIVISVVVPILVVPNGRLWVVQYDPAGSVTSGPVAASHIAYFVDRTFEVPSSLPSARGRYTLSHLEICEIAHLPELLRSYLDDERLSFNPVVETFFEQHRPK